MNVTARKISVLLLLGAFVATLVGCNTIRGVGKDTQKVGEEIEEAADDHD